jgi:ABC-type uncharacterized transport system permease subunit
MGERTDTERMAWLDQTWVKVYKFPAFFWMSDRSDVHEDYRATHALSPLTLCQAIDAAIDAEKDPTDG